MFRRSRSGKSIRCSQQGQRRGSPDTGRHGSTRREACARDPRGTGEVRYALAERSEPLMILAHISHQLSTATAYLGRCSRRDSTSATAPCVALPPASLQSSCVPGVVPASTALCSENVLNVVHTTPARIFSHTPCIHGHLRALATIRGEKCGLAGEGSSYLRPVAGLNSPRRCITRTVRSTNSVSTSSLQANRLPSVLAGDLRMDN